MRIADTILTELEREAATTRKVLERVPTDKLTWKPHEKSMTLGTLAGHIASLPGRITSFATADVRHVEQITRPDAPDSTDGILDLFDKGMAEAKSTIGAMDDETLNKDWSFAKGGVPFMTMPRHGLFRVLLLNHQYHHRGQLSVYLRLLDVPVPSIYGPSADENPFS